LEDLGTDTDTLIPSRASRTTSDEDRSGESAIAAETLMNNAG
jgi:hypothetical protein